MRHTHTRLAATVCSALALALASAPPARGQNVPQPPSAGKESPPRAGVLQKSATLSGGPLLAALTVERRGRLLVLTYGPKSAGGALSSNAGPRGEPPQFAVYQGQRQIASGRFEYG